MTGSNGKKMPMPKKSVHEQGYTPKPPIAKTGSRPVGDSYAREAAAIQRAHGMKGGK